ncbi:MAG: glucosaminidase domain-containing protein [Sphingomonadales bacterium]
MVRKNIKRVLVLSTVAAFILMIMATLAIILAPPPQRLTKTPDPIQKTALVLYPTFLDYKYPDPETGEVIAPRFYITDLPEGLSLLPTVEKKIIFTNALLPLILRANELIMEDRKRAQELAQLIQKGGQLKKADQNWLFNLLKRYKIPRDQIVKNTNFKLLFIRLDTIPPSLGIAQAAIESGWGTSRFAQEGNALYGQWTWGRDEAEGIVPTGREEGETHSIRVFRTPMESVLGYVRNLNTHLAYKDLRELRAYARKNNYSPSGIELAETLTSYSTRGEDYTTDLQNIIDSNNFLILDDAKLSEQISFAP